MPEYTIVAGPNGAGKSSFSEIYANGVNVHDADKYKVAFQKLYPGVDIDYEVLHDHLAERYRIFESTELWQRNSMLVESNLRDEYLIGRALFMRSQGYKLNLIFVALENTIIAKERVMQRVEDNGHYVGVFAIEENFINGLINLKKHIGIFDNFMLVTPNLQQVSGIYQPPTPILNISSNRVVYYLPYHQQWANDLAVELMHLATGRPINPTKH
jgi:predicted ABC-type ATPase